MPSPIGIPLDSDTCTALVAGWFCSPCPMWLRNGLKYGNRRSRPRPTLKARFVIRLSLTEDFHGEDPAKLDWSSPQGYARD